MASLFRPRGSSRLSYCISFLRHYAQTKIRKPSLPKLVKLDDRRVIRIKGQDSAKFLQGMITNDLAQLENEDCNVMFSMFLNSQGRVLYDALLYSVPYENSEYFLEVGSAAVEGIVKVLKMYKLRAKVEFVDASSEVDVWAMFSESGLIETDIQSDQKIVAHKDPRLDALGIRMLVPWNQSPVDLLNIGPYITVGPAVYDEHRYKLGVAEGIDEIPQGNALPLEYNLAWINGGLHRYVVNGPVVKLSSVYPDLVYSFGYTSFGSGLPVEAHNPLIIPYQPLYMLAAVYPGKKMPLCTWYYIYL